MFIVIIAQPYVFNARSVCLDVNLFRVWFTFQLIIVELCRHVCVMCLWYGEQVAVVVGCMMESM